MLVYRVGRSKWSKDVTGEGSRKHGGRWNQIGIPCIYTSSNRALAILEYSVHTPLENIPRALSFTSFEIPENKIFICEEASLPGTWRNFSYSIECINFGSDLIKNHLVIRLPSIVVPYEHNYILNPLFPSFNDLISISNIEDYSYDIRIKI